MKKTEIVNKEIKVTFDDNLKTFGKYIYLLKFPDNSIYVGKAASNIGDRIQNHCTHYKTKYTRKDKAIDKFKEFEVVILRECLGNAELEYYEWYYIQAYAKAIFKEIMPDTEYSSEFKNTVKFQLLNDTLL